MLIGQILTNNNNLIMLSQKLHLYTIYHVSLSIYLRSKECIMKSGEFFKLIKYNIWIF